mgnify:CR=1 FL=1
MEVSLPKSGLPGSCSGDRIDNMKDAEEEIQNEELGFAFGTFEEIFRKDPHECTCHSCNVPLTIDCYSCGKNDWELVLFGRHLQMKCRKCGRGLCLNTEATSLQISRYLLSPESEVTGTVLAAQVKEVLSSIMHPEIGRSLYDLGMLRDISVNVNKATVTLATPYAKVPIEDLLINRVKEAVNQLGIELVIQRTVMTEEERKRFLSLGQGSCGKTLF